MNKERRKALSTISAQLESLKDELQAVYDEEDEAKSNLPDSLQEGEKGQAMDDAISAMSSAIDAIDEAVSQIGTATGEA